MNTNNKSQDTNAASETSFGTAAVAFLVGATAGVAAGILLAPKAAELTTDLRTTALEMAACGRQAVDDAVDAGARDAHDAIDTTEAVVRLGAKKSREAVDSAANSLHMATKA